jgi:hypothetical protein
MDPNVQIIWQINLTVVAVVLGWVASAIVGVVFLMRQRDVVQDTNKKIDELRIDREAKASELDEEDRRLRMEINTVNAAFSLFKEGSLRDNATRKELQDQRAEQQAFLADMKRELLDSINRVVTRVDSLHNTMKQNGNH